MTPSPANAPLIQCVPNFSEGRRPEVINAIVAAANCVSTVRLADWSADPDHNRLVVTLVGRAADVMRAVCRAADAAIAHIDLSQHTGAHPRLGALDVCPLVPLANITLAECAELARAIARRLSDLHALPVFLYEAASDDPARTLPYVRKHAFHSLMPDFGPSAPHPTAGAAVIGARPPLIAFNVNLNTDDQSLARALASELREGGSSGFQGVRALGLYLPSRRLAQVSMNVTQTDDAPLLDILAYLQRRARELGTSVRESEVIGALPGPAAFQLLTDALRAPALRPSQVLWENWPS